jgi:uroporphyrinogen decarboxylase
MNRSTHEFLTPRERVLMAIRHQETDRLPRGEFLVEEAFLNRLYPEKVKASFTKKMRHLVQEVDLDLVTVRIIHGEEGNRGLKELGKWAIETPCFVMALLDGLFWKPEDPLTFEEFILGIRQGEGRIGELIQIKKERALDLIQRCLDEGAHGLIIGDDLAYNRGTFVSPEDLRIWVFPGLQEMVEAIKMGNGMAFLHSCGNLTEIVDMILHIGFDGLHGLAPSAGNDPMAIREKTQKRLALMGIFEVDRLLPRQLEAMKEEILPALAAGGGYILGSAEGLSMNTPLGSFRALHSLKSA